MVNQDDMIMFWFCDNDNPLLSYATAEHAAPLAPQPGPSEELKFSYFVKLPLVYTVMMQCLFNFEFENARNRPQNITTEICTHCQMK